MTVIIILFIILIALLLESEREKNCLSVENYLFRSGKVRQTYKIVFLTDLHDKEFGKDNIRLIETVRNLKPDLILFGGDMLVTKRGKSDFKVLESLLANLKDICPLVYANGNHELRFYREDLKDTYGLYRKDFEQLLAKYGVIFLKDAYMDFGDLRVYGLDLDRNCYKHFLSRPLKENYLSEHLPPTDKNHYDILLAHSPLYFDAYAKWGADLTLAGHFHGGVLRIGKQGVLTSQWQLFHKWCCGQFSLDRAEMIVSRGLGGHTINVRLNNLPELSVIEIKTEKD